MATPHQGQPGPGQEPAQGKAGREEGDGGKKFWHVVLPKRAVQMGRPRWIISTDSSRNQTCRELQQFPCITVLEHSVAAVLKENRLSLQQCFGSLHMNTNSHPKNLLQQLLPGTMS